MIQTPPIPCAYHYSLDPSWQQSLIDVLGGTLEDDKILTLPASVATGQSIFLQVLPGLSVSLFDFIFHQPIAFSRVPSNEEFLIAYFEMSDEMTTHVTDGIARKISYHATLGMGLLDCSTLNDITVPVDTRMYNLRLLIDKQYLKTLVDPYDEMEVNKLLFDQSKNTMSFYSHIDSKSKILLNSLKNKSFDDPTIEVHLRGLSFHLLYYLVEKSKTIEPILTKISEHDISKIMVTSEYLLKNLLSNFPGLTDLADMAEMSLTKYNLLFKKMFKVTPKAFFTRQKLLLGRKLLQNGHVTNIQDLAYELGYSKPSYFSALYKKEFGDLPSADRNA